MFSKNVSMKVLLRESCFYPGDVVCGVVEITVSAPIQYSVLRACVVGEEKSNFGFSFGKKLDFEALYTTYLRQGIILAGRAPPKSIRSGVGGDSNDSDTTSMDTVVGETRVATSGMMPGRYVFPFRLQLPDVLPPSHEERQKTGVTKLTYSVKVKLCGAGQVIDRHKVEFLLRMLPVNKNDWENVHVKRGVKQKQTGKDALGIQRPNLNEVVQGMDDGSMPLNATFRGTTLLVDHTKQLYEPEEMIAQRNTVEEGKGGKVKVCEVFENGTPAKNSIPVSCRAHRPSLNNWMTSEDCESNESFDEISRCQNNDDNYRNNTKEDKSIAMGSNDVIEGNKMRQMPSDIIGHLTNPSSIFVPEDSTMNVRQNLEIPVQILLKKGSVFVSLMFQSLIYRPGDNIWFCAVVDNAKGVSTISKVSFRLVKYVDIYTLMEKSCFKTVLQEQVVHQEIARGGKAIVTATQIRVPKEASLTLFTAGCSCRVFLEVKVSLAQGLATQLETARTEVVLVESFAVTRGDTRSRNWTNHFLSCAVGKGEQRPDIICPFVTEGKIRVTVDEPKSKGNPSKQKLTSSSSITYGDSTSEGVFQSYPFDVESVLFYPPVEALSQLKSSNPLLYAGS